jgi:hypothetical protein
MRSERARGAHQGRTGLQHTAPVGRELVESLNAQIRAEARPSFTPKTITRKRGDQDPQVSLEERPAGEDPKGAGDSVAGRAPARTKAEQYPAS